MLHPDQFEVNEAWIVFRLNDKPLHTELEGDVNCIVLMDAASGFLLGFVLVPPGSTLGLEVEARQLLDGGEKYKKVLPRLLFAARGEAADLVTQDATARGVEVVPVADDELHEFTREVRESFGR